MKSLLIAATAALVVAAAMPAQAADVAVWRGGSWDTPAGQSRTVHGVTEIRGVVAAPGSETVTAAPVPVESSVHIAAGGARIWFYDAAKAQLTVCRDHPTTDLGVYDLDCRTEALGL